MRLISGPNTRRVRPATLGLGFFTAALVSLFMIGAGSASTSALAPKPPTLRSPPVITGIAQEGQVLRANTGRWLPRTVRGAAFSFQWRLCTPSGDGCVDIAKATDGIYAVRHGDVGHALRVTVTAIARGLSASASSAPTEPVNPAQIDAPVNTVRPTISGSPLQGAVLTAQGGTWSGEQPIRFRYRWRSCAEVGGSCRDLDRTGQTYALRRRDVDRLLRVLVIAENPIATSAALSDPTTSVSGPAPPVTLAPRNTGEPRITGTPRVGEVLRTTRGTWTGTEPITYTYRWRRCQGAGEPDATDCARIGGARSATYVARPADAGFRLRSLVTATNEEGSKTATSNPTEVIAPARPAVLAPKATGEPRITGNARVGEVLRTTRGTWTGTEPITFAYRWRRCDGRGRPDASDCAMIANASDGTYVVREADVGFRLRSQVTAANAQGSQTATSNPTEVVTSARPTNTSEPSISGAPVVGNRLAANRGAWIGNEPITYAFQWLRCNAKGDDCVEVAGGTDNQHLVAEDELGRTLRVRVTARNDAGSRSALSNPTNAVGRLQPPPQPSGVILLRSGERSIPVGNVPTDARLIVSQVRFSPNPVRSRVRPITVRIRVVDTRGFVVRGALVFIRSVPRRTTGGNLQPTAVDGWATYRLQPLRHFPVVNGNVQFFVKAYRAGDPPLAGVAGYRLVQVRVRTAGL